jgi:protein-S-isoprenylcysteine O-methyltransferase Ste14
MPRSPAVKGVSLARLVLGGLVQPALVALLLFGPAPTFAWWRAWLLIALSSVATIASLVVMQRDAPELLAERFKPPIQAGQPRADKLVVLVFIAAFTGAILFIPKDVFEWRLLPPPGALVAGAGLGLFVVGWWIVLAALRANAFAVPVVKDQAARRQRVADTGPYAVVRHPMYAGVAVLMIGMALWLGSSAGAVVALVPIAVLAVRIGIEERFLRATLDGYAAYADRVRARLVPWVW